MGWKKLLKSIRNTGQDALGTARDKLVNSFPFPAKEDMDDIDTEASAPLRSSKSKDQGRGRTVDLDAEKRDRAAAAQSSAASGAAPATTKGIPKKATSTPNLPPVRGGGVPSPSASSNGAGKTEEAGKLSNRMNAITEMVQERYEHYGSVVSATILTYALQSGGMQRLVLRLGGTPWNTDDQNHDEVISYLEKSGVEAFFKAMGITSGGSAIAAAGSESKKKHRASNQPSAPGEFRVKSNVAPRAANDLPPQRRADTATGGNPRLKLEGEHFKPVKLQDNLHRRDAMGRRISSSSHSAGAATPSLEGSPALAKTQCASAQTPGISPPSVAPAAAAQQTASTGNEPLAAASPFNALWNPPVSLDNADTQELKSQKTPPPSIASDLLKKALED